MTLMLRALLAGCLTCLCSAAVLAEEHGAPHRTFAWKAENMHFFDAPRFSNSPVKAMLEEALVEALTARGLTFVESAEGADLELSYVAALENQATVEEIAVFRASHPDIAALEEGPALFEQGVLFAKLAARGSGAIYWQSTYRGLAVLDMPDEERRRRLDELMEEFLVGLP